jgi:hypothetical protein
LVYVRQIPIRLRVSAYAKFFTKGAEKPKATGSTEAVKGELPIRDAIVTLLTYLATGKVIRRPSPYMTPS